MAPALSALLNTLAPQPHLAATFVQPDFSGGGFVPAQPAPGFASPDGAVPTETQNPSFEAAIEAETERRALANPRIKRSDHRAAAWADEVAKRSRNRNRRSPTSTIPSDTAPSDGHAEMVAALDGLTIENTLFHSMKAAALCGEPVTRQALKVGHGFTDQDIDAHWLAAVRRHDAWWRDRAQQRGEPATMGSHPFAGLSTP